MKKTLKSSLTVIGAIFIIGIIPAIPVFGQGIAFHGFGAANEGMAGASTAAPIDAAGALQWNPAAIMGLESSEMSFGLGVALPTMDVESKLPNAMGGLGGGSTGGEPGAVPIPSMAIVRKVPNSSWAWGLQMGVIGGSRLNYRGCDASSLGSQYFNPVLAPQNATMPDDRTPISGYGSLNADIQILQLAPTIAFQATERLSLGFAPTLVMANISCHPLYLVQSPGLTTDPHYGTQPQYIDPSGTGTRWAWGGGFQLGAYYDTQCGWRFGLSYKSRQWVEDFRYNIVHVPNAAGVAAGKETVVETIKVSLEYPDIISFGVSYDGFENWLLAVDFRYFFYKEAAGFHYLHWENVFGVNVGIQRVMTDRLTLRCGYSFNENPIPDEAARNNVASPLIQQHGVYLGASLRLTCRLTAHVAYNHMFESSVKGSYFGAEAAQRGLPTDGYVKSTVSNDALFFSLSLGF